MYGDHKLLEQILAEAKQLSPIELSELLAEAQDLQAKAIDPLAGLVINSDEKNDDLLIEKI